MKIGHLLLLSLPFVPLIELVAPIDAKSLQDSSGTVPEFPPVLVLCIYFYFPAICLKSWLGSTCFFYFPNSGFYWFVVRYLFLPTCLLQSALLSFLLWCLLRAYQARRDKATRSLHPNA